MTATDGFATSLLSSAPTIDAPHATETAVESQHRAPWRLLVATALPAGLVGAIYATTFRDLAAAWDIDPNYSHGYAVPIVSLLFAWRIGQSFGWPTRSEVQRRPWLLGLSALIVGLALHVAAQFVSNLFFDVVSLVCVLRGTILCLGGQSAARAFGFPVWFLIFMAPLPMAWYQPVAVLLQQIVSGISTWFLNVTTVPAFQEGFRIHLPGYTMEVGEACSGLRQLTAVVALAAAIGHLSGRRAWFGWTLAILSLPIAVLANGLRVMVSGHVMLLFGPEWAEGIYHTLEGMVLVAVAGALVAATAWLLNRIANRLNKSRAIN
jgi:exosortase